MSIKSRTIVILGYSEIGERFAETAYGEFATIGAAEIKGRASIKLLDWVVANRVVREERGKSEITYDFLTDVQKPRRGYAD